MAWFTLLAATGSLSGCDGGGGAGEQAVPCTSPDAAPAGPVAVQTDCAAYASGDSLILSFRNTSEQSYVYGSCGLSLEQQEGGTWIEVEGCSFGPQAGIDGAPGCTCEAYGVHLDLDSESTLGLPLFSGLAPGRYRVRAEVSTLEAPTEGQEQSILSFSNAFEVR